MTTILRTGHEAPHNGVFVKLKLPKKPMKVSKMIERLEDALANLEAIDCCFWACKGPRKPQNMITCKRCWAIRDIQVVLNHLRLMK